MPPNDNYDETFRNLKDQIYQQSQLINQHSQQILTLQQHLGILTDMTTRLAVVEERREQDRENIKSIFGQLETVRGRVDVLHTQVTARFPIYDSLHEVYKTLNAKLWTAILTGVLGLVLAGGKMVLGLGS